jgi:putative transposase
LTLTRDWLDSAIENRQVTVDGMAVPTEMNLVTHSEDDLKEALQRQAILEGRGGHVMKCDRTLRRWIARQAVAVANGEDEVLALVPRTYLRGNRRSRMSPIQLELMARIKTEVWSQSEAASLTSCHEALVLACEEAGVRTPSLPTLRQFIKAATTNRDVRNRHGKRVAYQEGDFVEDLCHDTPVHGSRPFQYVHIDHTELDVELISSRTGKSLGRPWLTLVIDAYTRRVLAFYLCFHPPSYVSVMMVMRDFVRRHGRLPEFIITDNGKELRASAFMLFLKAMGVHQRLRPAGRPRHGSVLERLFGILNTRYIHNLAGNTKAMKQVRMTTGTHLPVNLAEWTLENLYHGIAHWAFEFYDQEVHPTLGMSPREMFQRGQKISGTRPQRRIIYNQDFLIATCPPADRGGQRKVHPQTGVKVGDRHYLHADFRVSRFAEKLVQVRVDPWDASSVYVRLGHHWVRARCNSLVSVGQLTETEHRAFAAEYRARHRSKAKGPEDVQRLREFRQVFTPEGAMATAFEREAENKALYSQLCMASVSPVAALSKTRLIEEKTVGAPPALPSDGAPASPASKGVPKARQRSASPSPSTPSSPQPPETPAADDLPDFDEF